MLMKHSLITLLVCLLGIVSVQTQAQTIMLNGCQSGFWELTSKDVQADGSYLSNRATSTSHCLFDGSVSMDEFRMYAEQGKVVFRGMSLTSIADEENKQKTLWAMVGDSGLTITDGHLDKGVLKTEGSGKDNSGSFMERSTTTYPSEDQYIFVLERSYDQGSNWISPYNEISAKRVSDAPPPLPIELDEAVAKNNQHVRAVGSWHLSIRIVNPDGSTELRHGLEKVTVILDGLAELSEISEFDTDGTLVSQKVRFSSRYADTWRSVLWTVGSSTVLIDELPVNSLSGHQVNNGQMDRKTSIKVSELSPSHYVMAIKRDDQTLLNVIGHKLIPEPKPIVSPLGTEVTDFACRDYNFVLGNWKLNASSLKPDGSRNHGVGYVHAYPIHDNSATAAEMHVFFEDGTGFRGTTTRVYNVMSGRWDVAWISDGGKATTGHSIANNTDVCDEIWASRDQRGTFKDTLRLFDITHDRFEVQMNRLYDGNPRIIKDIWVYTAFRLQP